MVVADLGIGEWVLVEPRVERHLHQLDILHTDTPSRQNQSPYRSMMGRHRYMVHGAWATQRNFHRIVS